MAERLKSCPFCGCLPDLGVALSGTVILDTRTYFAKCPGCRAELPVSPSREEAIAAWNRRANPQDGGTGGGEEVGKGATRTLPSAVPGEPGLGGGGRHD